MSLVVAAAVIDERRVLAAQRSYPAHLRGHWEFPGGKVEPGETAAEALIRECREELGTVVEIGPVLGCDVPIGRFGQPTSLRLFQCRLGENTAIPRESSAHQRLRWLGAEEIESVPWLITNRQLLPRVVKILSSRP